ncbi:unnamed protein product [Ixodes pacificus]
MPLSHCHDLHFCLRCTVVDRKATLKREAHFEDAFQLAASCPRATDGR